MTWGSPDGSNPAEGGALDASALVDARMLSDQGVPVVEEDGSKAPRHSMPAPNQTHAPNLMRAPNLMPAPSLTHAPRSTRPAFDIQPHSLASGRCRHNSRRLGGIPKWEDSPPRHNDATSPTARERPTLNAMWRAGKPSVTFDGTQGYLALPQGFDDFSQGLSLFVVAEASGRPAARRS